MTICTAGISKEGVILASDCRVTYLNSNIFSDSLLKTYPLSENASISFAGDIDCAKYIITQLNEKHLARYAEKGVFQLLIHTAKQLRNLYNKYCLKSPRCHIAFLLTGYSNSNCWIGACESPKFELDLTNSLFAARTIGDTPRARIAVSEAMIDATRSSFVGDNLVLLASSAVDGALNLLYYDDGFSRDVDHGVSGLFTMFRIGEAGLQFVPQRTEMFRGRIADRNKPLGHALTNSVTFDPSVGRFFLHDHQNGKTNVLSELNSFRRQMSGVVRTNFDPYKLKPS